ncbi:MAG TPA: hypothetical protein VK550_34365 [Polyangiaceae bacterium]|nr:hypothetical protein [Polyangiaceae bacterium]
MSGATISNVVNGCKAPGPRVIDGFAEALQDSSLPHVPSPPRERTDGRPLVALARATEFRDNLALADIRRPQLFELNATRRHIVIHDLRATFVTVHMALGKSEAWITDRTGHTSSSMLHKYKRAARSHQELGLGPLCPLNQALPELRDDAAARVPAAVQAPNLAVTQQLTDDSGDDMSIYNYSAAAREELPNSSSSKNFSSCLVIDLARARINRKCSKLHNESPGIRANPLARAVEWQRQLDAGQIENRAAIARREGLTRARVTQVMNRLRRNAR